MATIYMTEGDTDPDFTATLTRADGTAVDLTGTTVEFSASQPRGGPNAFTNTCTITSATNGEVTYKWQDGDTDEPGRYRAEFKVTYGNGEVEHFPNDGYHTLLVKRNTEAK